MLIQLRESAPESHIVTAAISTGGGAPVPVTVEDILANIISLSRRLTDTKKHTHTHTSEQLSKFRR